MPKLKQVVEKIEDVEEGLREYYVEKDGKFYLDSDAPTPADMDALRKNLANARRVEEAAKKEAARWKKLGELDKDVDEILELIEKAEKQIDDHPDIDAIRKTAAEAANKEAEKRVKKIEAERDQIVQERDSLKSSYERSTISSAVTSAINEHKGRVKALTPVVMQYVKPEYDEGQLKLVVYGDDQQKRLNGKGDLLSVNELVAELSQSEEFAYAFAGSGNSGGGGRPNNGGGGGRQSRPNLGITKKSDFGSGITAERKRAEFIGSYPTQEEGLKAYKSLPDA